MHGLPKFLTIGAANGGKTRCTQGIYHQITNAAIIFYTIDHGVSPYPFHFIVSYFRNVWNNNFTM